MTVRSILRLTTLLGAGGVLWLAPLTVSAQPAPPSNLKILPADIERPQLFGIMQRFTVGLGVQCTFCHVQGDFASDENHHKDIARTMMKMTQAARGAGGDFLEGERAGKVNCWTCHRGEAHIADPPEPPARARGRGKKAAN